MQKIIICGFPHSGTTILKSIMGHIDDVEEIYNETDTISLQSKSKFVLCKWPFISKGYHTTVDSVTKDNFFMKKNYDDYIKIFIIRNPLFVFSSLNKRYSYNIPLNHSIDVYINTIKQFVKYTNEPQKNIYTIKYEDMFDNNFQLLKTLFNTIGINYNDNIFNNDNYTNILHTQFQLSKVKPKNPAKQHMEYRTWQINQPFVSNNDNSKIHLNESQKQQIINNEYILTVYPDIKNIN